MPYDEMTTFAGGVHSRVRSIWSPKDQQQALFFWDDAENWDLSEEGILKFKGWEAALSSALSGTPKITGIFEYKSGGTSTLVVCADEYIYTVAAGTPTQVASGQTVDAYYQASMWNDGTDDILILCNGADTPVAYNGSTCSTITYTDPSSIWDSATPQGITVFRDRVFYWGDPTYPYRIYTPAPGTHNDFDNSNNTVDAFDVEPGYGGVLTGLRPLTNDLLIIYKENVIRRLSGTAPFASGGDQFSISVVTDEVGCVAPRTIVQVGADHYFLGKNGMRQLKPVQSYGDLDHLQPTYPIQDKINDLNWTYNVIKNACAAYFQPDNHIYLCVPDGANTTNNKTYVYDTITQGITPRSSLSASVITEYNRTLYHGDYAGLIHSHGGANGANGATIAAFAESKWMAHAGLAYYKRYRRIVIFAEGEGATDLTILYKVLKRGEDMTTASTESIQGGNSLWDVGKWDEMVWAAGSQAVFEIKNIGRGKALKLRFENTSASQRPVIRQIGIEYDVFSAVKG